MLILFLRAIILYTLVFVVIRMTGKRQLSDLQPFDLIVTLLIADLASEPAADTGIPLLYGVVPILALFLVQQTLALLSLKSERVRKVICGEPLVIVSRGVVVEHALRVSRYTLADLLEQLRGKDVFDVSEVEFAVLETNGDLSVLLAGKNRQPTYQDMKLAPPPSSPPYMLIQDGKTETNTLLQCGHDAAWLDRQLARCRLGVTAVLYASLTPDGKLHIQSKQKMGGRVYTLDVRECI